MSAGRAGCLGKANWSLCSCAAHAPVARVDRQWQEDLGRVNTSVAYRISEWVAARLERWFRR